MKTTEEKVQHIPLAKIFVSTRNTRQPTEKDPDVIELAASLKAQGQITPGLARPHPEKPGCFELGAGARPRVASGVAGLETMKLVVREMTDDELDAVILVENFQRLDPSPRAEAELLRRLVERGTTTPAAIAAACGRPESWAIRRMRLLDVIPELFKKWKLGGDLYKFSVEMMEFLGSLPVATQQRFAKEHHRGIYAKSRKELEAAFAEDMCSLDKAPFDLNDPATFVDGCGPGCKNDSSKADQLFDFGGKCGRCLAPTCFFARLAKARQAEYDALAQGEELEIVSEKYMGEVKIGTNTIRPEYGEWNIGKIVAKAPEKGGTKVVCILATGKMAVRYTVKSSGSSSSGRSGNKPKSANEKRKEKVALLQSKRWAAVREDLIKAVKAATVADLTCDIVDLVTAIGLPYRLQSERYSADTKAWKIMEHRLAGFPLYKQSQRELNDTVPREEALWSAAKQVLLGLIPEPDKVSNMVNYAPNLEGIAGLIKYPIDSKKREADLQILPAKSWGPTDPHTLEPLGTKPAAKPIADRLKKPAAAEAVPIPKVTAKPKAKAKAGTWIDVGDTTKKKPAAAVARNAKKPAKK